MRVFHEIWKSEWSLTFRINLRKLNSRTIKDAYTLPRIEDILDRLVGANILTNWISKMDTGRWSKRWKTKWIKVLKVLFGVDRSEISVMSVIYGFETNFFSCEKQFFYLDQIFSISRFGFWCHLYSNDIQKTFQQWPNNRLTSKTVQILYRLRYLLRWFAFFLCFEN